MVWLSRIQVGVGRRSWMGWDGMMIMVGWDDGGGGDGGVVSLRAGCY